MNKKLSEKLATLPKEPGVYFHKNTAGDIIYIGKAAILRNRVRQYFQKSRYRDPKTDLLVAEIADVEWTVVASETDALFLEAELVRRYLPPYNIMLRDDKSLEYVRIDYKSDYPTVTTVRRPLDDGAEYFGPYMNGYAVKRALRYLRRIFPYATRRPIGAKRANLQYHLGLDPGLEGGHTRLEDYRSNLRQLMQYLKGNRVSIIREIEHDMKQAAKAEQFELAAKLRNRLRALQALESRIIFSDREFLDTSKDFGLEELRVLLGLSEPPARVEGFDISHMQGTDTAASMVVFSNGVPDKSNYRKLKMRIPGNDDFAHMAETIARRFSIKNNRAWGVPALVLIDGGKGQLSAALQAREQSAAPNVPMIGLAKKHEEIIIHSTKSNPNLILNEASIRGLPVASGYHVKSSGDFVTVELPESSHALRLLQRIRDESHRFAVSYHTSMKRTRQTKSALEDIVGVGPQTRKILLRKFGSVRAITHATEAELADVIGIKKAILVSKALKDNL